MLKKWFKYSLLFLLFFVIFSSCVSVYIIPAKQYNYAKTHGPFDAIIVPGIPYNEAEGWDSIMKMRVLWSVYLYKQGITKNIIYTGSSVYTPYFESEIMRLYAIKLGVDSNHIFTEIEAKHGVENLYYSYKMGKEMGFENLAVATDPGQNLQIAYYGKPMSSFVDFVPAVLSKISFSDYDTIFINPASAFNNNFVPYIDNLSIKERLKRSAGKTGIKKKMTEYLKHEEKE